MSKPTARTTPTSTALTVPPAEPATGPAAGSAAGSATRTAPARRTAAPATASPADPPTPQGAASVPAPAADGDGPGRPPRRRRPFAGARRTRPLPPWSLLAAGVLVGGLLGTAYGLVRPAEYTATSYVVVVPTEQSDPASALGFAQAYGRVATQLAVLGDAQKAAGVSVATLRDGVRTATSPDAPMVSVSATSTRPREAAAMANAVSLALTRHANASAAGTHVELRQFAPAPRPAEASSASATVTGLVGASAGGLLGGLALLVRPRRPARGAARTAAVPGPAPAADVRGRP